jgi:ABC-2 type transport system permease protein
MPLHKIFISIQTIVTKEVKRFMRIWIQTLLAPVITTALYFIIFGGFIGSQVKPLNGFSYMQFIVPGLVMMAIINGSFQSTVSTFFQAKMMKNLEELLVSPTPHWAIVLGFVLGGVARGVLLGAIVLLCAAFFVPMSVHSLFLLVLFGVLTSAIFSIAGLINAVYAKGFDGISIIPTFVLTPLTYLGGVFYSVKLLPHLWQTVSLFNPIVYMINGFRYGLLGISDASITLSLSVLLGTAAILTVWTLLLFKSGKGMQM